jgi:hypothetical protein
VKDTRRLASGPGYVPHDRSIFATVWTHHSAHHSAHQPFSAFLFCTLTPRGAGRSAVKHGEPRDLASDTMDGRALFLCYPPPGCDMVHTLPLTHTLHRRAATWYTPCPSPTPSTAGLRHGTHPAPHPRGGARGCTSSRNQEVLRDVESSGKYALNSAFLDGGVLHRTHTPAAALRCD